MNFEDTLVIQGIEIPPNSEKIIDLPIAELYTHTPLSLPIQVIRGKTSPICLFISAAIHGDELNGVEVIRRLLLWQGLKQLKGTLIAIPIVNIYGLLHHSRYLPDRRDLNRSFPGSESGSLAARLAHLVMTEVVAHCTHGIDLHTGAIHRANLPQLRVKLEDSETTRLAHAFGVPVILSANERDGSLRQEAMERGLKILVYEGGEALRFDEFSIRAGLRGIIAVMRALGMLPSSRRKKPVAIPFVAHNSTWVRSPRSGIFRTTTALGNWVKKDAVLGVVADPFGRAEVPIRAHVDGLIIGHNSLPLVNEGEALFHIARFQDDSTPTEVTEQLEAFHTAIEDDSHLPMI